jgi:hypothetical protein
VVVGSAIVCLEKKVTESPKAAKQEVIGSHRKYAGLKGSQGSWKGRQWILKGRELVVIALGAK